MQPGVYYVGPNGGFQITKSNIVVNGTGGVTIILTNNQVIDASKANNSQLNITAPTSGATEGVALWEPATTPAPASPPVNYLGGNAFTANLVGIIYTPNAEVDYNGNTGSTTNPNCVQIVASIINFGGQSINLTSHCSGVPGLKQFGQLVSLVE
jgi:hypothetical protein